MFSGMCNAIHDKVVLGDIPLLRGLVVHVGYVSAIYLAAKMVLDNSGRDLFALLDDLIAERNDVPLIP